jgi:hypothetical protein
MGMFSLGMKTPDQKEAAFCTRHMFWENANSVIKPIMFPLTLKSYPRQLNTILWKMSTLLHLHHYHVFLEVGYTCILHTVWIQNLVSDKRIGNKL